MADHALVIGCDAYWSPGSHLRGAVADALRMRSWLLDPDRGNVPSQHIVLLLSPGPHSTVPPHLSGTAPATRRGILAAVDAVLDRSAGDTGTLYCYFAGHGLTARLDRILEPCLLPTDYAPDNTEAAVPVAALRDRLSTGSLRTQFMFLDACRSSPAGNAFAANGFSGTRAPDFGLPQPDQYVLLATDRAGTAAEDPDGGVFTGALLRGLDGAGPAKTWDADAEEYVVRLDDLFVYVQRELATVGQTSARMDNATRPNPVLVRRPQDAFPPVRLTVNIAPEAAAATTKLGVFGPGDRLEEPPLRNPTVVELPPRDYSVRVYAPDFVPRRQAWPVRLYEDRELLVELVPGQPTAEHGYLFSQSVTGPQRVGRPAGLAVTASDPTAVIQVTDEAGRVTHRAGDLRIELSGRYRIGIVEPEFAGPVEYIELLPGARESLHLAPVAPGLPDASHPTRGAAGVAAAYFAATVGGLPPPTRATQAGRLIETVFHPMFRPDLAAVHDYSARRRERSGSLVVVVGHPGHPFLEQVSEAFFAFGPYLRIAIPHADPGPGTLRLGGPGPTLNIANYVPLDGFSVAVIDVTAEQPEIQLHAVHRGRPGDPVGTDRAQRFAARGRLSEAIAALSTPSASDLDRVFLALLLTRGGSAAAEAGFELARLIRQDLRTLPDTAVLDALLKATDFRPAAPEIGSLPVFTRATRMAAQLFTAAGQPVPPALAGVERRLLPGQTITAWWD